MKFYILALMFLMIATTDTHAKNCNAWVAESRAINKNDQYNSYRVRALGSSAKAALNRANEKCKAQSGAQNCGSDTAVWPVEEAKLYDMIKFGWEGGNKTKWCLKMGFKYHYPSSRSKNKHEKGGWCSCRKLHTDSVKVKPKPVPRTFPRQKVDH